MTCNHKTLRATVSKTTDGRTLYACAAKCGAPLFSVKPVEVTVKRGRKAELSGQPMSNLSSLIEWVDERIENCKRIAAKKTGEDQERWLEDAWYFEQIRQVLLQQNVTRADV